MRILIVAAPFGAGHLQAAQAVKTAFQLSQPAVDCQVADLTEVRALRLASQAYLWSLHHSPWLWQSLYRAGGTPGGRRRAGYLSCLTLKRRLLSLLAHYRPDVVAATHPFPLAALAWLRAAGQLTAPVAAIVTDFLPHPAWVSPGIDRYFIAQGDAATQQLQSLGVPGHRICTSGIPISPAFADFPPLRAGPDAIPRLLLMGGGLGLGPLPELATALAQLPRPVTVEVVTGSNQAAYQRLLEQKTQFPNLTVHGFTNQIPLLMRQADLLIGKPGGLTSSEALACGLPMVLVGALPGHEEENAHVLTQAGVATTVAADALAQTTMDLFQQPYSALAAMQQSARSLGRPRAALDVAQHLLTLAHPRIASI